MAKINKPIFLWSSIIIIGLVVKLLHLLSSAFIIIGFAGLNAYILIEIFFKRKKTVLNYTLLSLGFLFLTILLLGACFNNGYPINSFGVIIYIIFFSICVGYYGLKNWIKK